MSHKDISLYIDSYYRNAEACVARGDRLSLPETVAKDVDAIIERSEASKGVMTVVITSLVYKLLHPEQDIRKHQSSIPEGYSGRTFDTQNITPYLKAKQFPSMAESGWLTRSLEQKVPYDKHYTGAIKPQAFKEAFLNTIEYIQTSETSLLEALLVYLLAALIRQRERNHIRLATPANLSINQTLLLLKGHFNSPYKYEGASRLPTLAIYAVYELLIQEVKRFQEKELLPLENHTSSDRQSGRLGDIDIVDASGRAFEAVEIKHNIPISLALVNVAYDKFISTGIERYYILSTADIDSQEQEAIEARILEIKNIHGCHLIVNGIFSTLRYYLRLLDNPATFIAKYTALLEIDNTIKYEHKVHWNTLVQSMLS